MIPLLLALAIQDLPTDKDADEAVRKFKEAVADAGEDGQIQALRDALQVKHERVVRALAPFLSSGSEKGRIALALALGDVDLPASAEVLVAGLSPNTKTPSVLAAAASSLGKLGWESSTPALHDLVRKVADPEIRKAIPDILAALGQIGSAGSVDPLVDLLTKVTGQKKNPWPNTDEIAKAARDALRAITGGDASKRLEFEDWWRANKAALVSNARKTWWSRRTHERIDVGPGERAPADAVFVRARLVEPPPETDAKKKRKKP